MKPQTIHITILSPEDTIFEGEAVAVWLPGVLCPFEILPNHAPIISTLGKGTITLRCSDNSLSAIEINGGIAKVNSNTVVVCV